MESFSLGDSVWLSLDSLAYEDTRLENVPKCGLESFPRSNEG